MKPHQSLVLICLLFFISCDKKSETISSTEPTEFKWKLTITDEELVGYTKDVKNKAKWYYWVKDKDTSNFKFRLSESKVDSLVQIVVEVKSPTDFKICLDSLNAIFPLIEKDFKLDKLNDFFIDQTIYYPDLTKEITSEYKMQFGRKNISHEKINSLLMELPLIAKLNSIISKYNVKVSAFSIEKFGIIDKTNFRIYPENYDFSDYPDFSIEGFTDILIKEK